MFPTVRGAYIWEKVYCTHWQPDSHVQGHKSTREVHFANWIVPPLSASNDSLGFHKVFPLLPYKATNAHYILWTWQIKTFLAKTVLLAVYVGQVLKFWGGLGFGSKGFNKNSSKYFGPLGALVYVWGSLGCYLIWGGDSLHPHGPCKSSNGKSKHISHRTL